MSTNLPNEDIQVLKTHKGDQVGNIKVFSLKESWVVPVTWEMCAYINVDADTLGEAMDIARDEAGTIPLPGDGADYVDGSWNLSSEDEDYLLSPQTEEVAAAHERQGGFRDDS